jgi:hypothetical protein
MHWILVWPALAASLWLLPSPGRAADTNVNYAPHPQARVCQVEAPGALVDLQPAAAVVRQMVEGGLTGLTRQRTVTGAWLSLVSTQDVVGIKVCSQAGLLSGTRPAVVAAVVQGLLAAGLPPQHLLIWDKHAAELQAAGFYQLGRQLGVRVAACDEEGYDEKSFYAPDTAVIGNLIWGDLEFGQKGPGIGRKSYVAKIVSRQLTKIISIAPLLNLEECGVSGHLYSLSLGSVDNTLRFESQPDRLAEAVPEIYALPVLGDRVVLNITDALLGQYEGGSRALLHYSTVLNQLWFSRDPVALDTLAIQELQRERQAHAAAVIPSHADLYNNAVLLQLGVNDPAQISVEKVALPPPGAGGLVRLPTSSDR